MIINASNVKLSFIPGPTDPISNAPHSYVLTGFNANTNPDYTGRVSSESLVLLFQNGVISEAGVNGVTPELILDVLIHRFEAFQAGRFACTENAEALESLCKAREAIRKRLLNRQARGVEGTYEKWNVLKNYIIVVNHQPVV